ncbi:unnamed protein product [Heligmosomoides polygyrus]|uniref:Uncharacterized protein n=1 Tax=Heligmosomoides polygyrus TaxID=6339 RepID=A0A183FD12_HELPZ|nr:unnamed protein product [Heligmosomoides polygyrus]
MNRRSSSLDNVICVLPPFHTDDDDDDRGTSTGGDTATATAGHHDNRRILLPENHGDLYVSSRPEEGSSFPPQTPSPLSVCHYIAFHHQYTVTTSSAAAAATIATCLYYFVVPPVSSIWLLGWASSCPWIWVSDELGASPSPTFLCQELLLRTLVEAATSRQGALLSFYLLALLVFGGVCLANAADRSFAILGERTASDFLPNRICFCGPTVPVIAGARRSSIFAPNCPTRIEGDGDGDDEVDGGVDM